MTAISTFMENIYKLEELRVWDELNGLNYHDLKSKGLDKTIVRRFLPAILILKESSPEVKYDVFDRLNTGGMQAEPMEIRNAIYQGKFNELLHKLSSTPTFRTLWGIPAEPAERQKNTTYARMDDLELVLRFFALRQYQHMKGRFKDYLSTFMDERNSSYKDDPSLELEDANLFERATANALKVFGTEAFRKPTDPGDKRSVKSAPLADAVLYALAEIVSSSIDVSSAQKIRETIDNLVKHDGEFRKAVGTGTNGKSATQYRLQTARKAVEALHIGASS